MTSTPDACIASVTGQSLPRRTATPHRRMRPSRITAEMYARIPALLEQGMTTADIAAMYGVTLGTLKGSAVGAAYRCAKAGQGPRVPTCCRHSARTQ
jgi:hypothetical protein